MGFGKQQQTENTIWLTFTTQSDIRDSVTLTGFQIIMEASLLSFTRHQWLRQLHSHGVSHPGSPAAGRSCGWVGVWVCVCEWIEYLGLDMCTILFLMINDSSLRFVNHKTRLLPATHSLSKLQRVHGCVWAALQDGTGVPESANRDCLVDPEKVSTAALYHLLLWKTKASQKYFQRWSKTTV